MNPINAMKTIGTTLLAKQNASNLWTNSVFSEINELKPDHAGKVGELFMAQLCNLADIQCDYTENINSKDGTYDSIILDKKVEIKTARIGIHGGFQHETLKTDGYDYLLFVDIMPDLFYLTVLPKFDMKIKHPIIGRTPHPRKGTSDVFKFDFAVTNLERAVGAGCSLKVGPETTMPDISDFIRRTVV
jgi:hypothetical protein